MDLCDLQMNGSVLIVCWSDPGNSYQWLKSWPNSHGIAFAYRVRKVESVRSFIPMLAQITNTRENTVEAGSIANRR